MSMIRPSAAPSGQPVARGGDNQGISAAISRMMQTASGGSKGAAIVAGASGISMNGGSVRPISILEQFMYQTMAVKAERDAKAKSQNNDLLGIGQKKPPTQGASVGTKTLLGQ